MILMRQKTHLDGQMKYVNVIIIEFVINANINTETIVLLDEDVAAQRTWDMTALEAFTGIGHLCF